MRVAIMGQGTLSIPGTSSHMLLNQFSEVKSASFHALLLVPREVPMPLDNKGVPIIFRESTSQEVFLLFALAFALLHILDS